MKPLNLNPEQTELVMSAMRKKFNEAKDQETTQLVIDACELLGLPQHFINELKSDFEAEYGVQFKEQLNNLN